MSPPAIYFWKTPTGVELIMLMAVGVFGSLSQTCNIMAFRAGEASAVAPLDYARLVYAVILGVLVFSEWPSAQVFIGAAIIIGAGLYNIMRERKVALEKRARVERPGDGLGGTLP
jgi:drug/metabolite transporter (DMT)-like permease